jgi:DNA polymerase alpha subunit B
MYEKLTEKGDLLNHRINHFAPLIAKEYVKQLEKSDENILDEMQIDKKMADIEPEDIIARPMEPHQEPHFYVGRVCCDSIENVSLNEHSIVLESSRELGAGAKVKLNLTTFLDNGGSFALFPGQIIGLEARNPSGNCLDVCKIFFPPDLPLPTTNVSDIKAYYSDGSRPLHIVVAAGPYTLDDGLGYEPLKELTEVLEKDPPDTIIFLGPFVDSQHGDIVEGKSDFTMSEIFRDAITPNLVRLAEARPGMNIILIPSIRDAIMEWVAFPQPPIASCLSVDQKDDRLFELGLHLVPQILLFPNPVQFTINEMLIAVSSLDVLLPMSSVQANKGPGEFDRISQQFQHIIQQRSFYPLFPSAQQANLDTTRALLTLGKEAGPVQLLARPDLIIIPSKLKACTKQVGGTLCVNPGLVTRGKAGGSFSRIVVHQLDLNDGDGDEETVHHVPDRTRVEVIKI